MIFWSRDGNHDKTQSLAIFNESGTQMDFLPSKVISPLLSSRYATGGVRSDPLSTVKLLDLGAMASVGCGQSRFRCVRIPGIQEPGIWRLFVHRWR